MKKGSFKKIFPHVSWPSVILVMLGSTLITTSSMYVALRMSALPWPTVFVAILSLSLMKLMRRRDLKEIQVTSTGMSAGAMVAGGLAFTIPGLFISGVWQVEANLSPKAFFARYAPPLLLAAVAGVVLGTLLCARYRRRVLDQLDLPYPIGTASAETLKAGYAGGRGAIWLFGAMLIAAVFVLLRDSLLVIPAMSAFAVAGVRVTINYSPMALSIGHLVGLGSSLYWFGGAVLAEVVLRRLGVVWGWFPDAEAAGGFIFTSAVGLMVGAGVATLVRFAHTAMVARGARTSAASASSHETSADEPTVAKTAPRLLTVAALAVSYLLTVLLGLSPLVSALLLVGVFVAAAMSALITGQTGINPMELFGIIVLLAVRLLVPLSAEHAFFVAAITAVACGYAGDMMNDFKTGKLLHASPRSQLLVELIGGLFGAAASVLVLLALIAKSGGVGVEVGLPAAQAHSVAAMVDGIGQPAVFAGAAAVGFLLMLAKIPGMILGIGMMLAGAGLSVPVLLGGLSERIIRGKSKETGAAAQMVASGLLGGEGLTGTIVAIVSMFVG